jgi:hypothetical protein
LNIFDTETEELAAAAITPATGFIQVVVTNPEHPFGGVLIQTPSEAPVTVAFSAGGTVGSEEAPAGGAVSSVFTRQGDVVAAKGDYTLNQIDPPVAAWILPGKIRIKADGSLQLWNSDQNKWHTLSVGGAVGGEYLMIGAGET